MEKDDEYEEYVEENEEDAKRSALWNALYEEHMKPNQDRRAKEKEKERAIETAKKRELDELYDRIEKHGFGHSYETPFAEKKKNGKTTDDVWDEFSAKLEENSKKAKKMKRIADRLGPVPDINGKLHGFDVIQGLMFDERERARAKEEAEENERLEPRTARGRPKKTKEWMNDDELRSRHLPVEFPRMPGRPTKTEDDDEKKKTYPVAPLPPCSDEPRVEQFDSRLVKSDGLKTTFAAGARSALGEGKTCLLQTRTLVHYCTWYRARREAWKEWLVPLEEQQAEFERRAEAHFFSDPIVLGKMAKLPHLNIVDFSTNSSPNIDEEEEFRKMTAVFRPKNEWPMMRKHGSSVSRLESDDMLFSRGSPFHRDPKVPSYERYTFFPIREPSDAPHECLRETLSKLSGHDRYLRCSTTLPDENLPLESDEVRFVHGSFRDVAEWNLFHETYERFADPDRGPTMALRTADGGRWLPRQNWGEGIEVSPLYDRSIVVRFSSLSFPSIVPPGKTLADLPWKDAGIRPPNATAEELATFAQVHAEVMSVHAARAAAKILCSRFAFRAPSAKVAAGVRAQLKEFCCVRYFRLRRIRALVASFGEFMFNPSLFNVQYRLLRVDPRWWPAVTKKDMLKRKKHWASSEAFERWQIDHYTEDERIFSKYTKSGTISLSPAYRARTVKLFWPKKEEFSDLPEEMLNEDAGCSMRVLYGLLMLRSLESLSISRMPEEQRAVGEERLADWLPEALVYDARFGAPLPRREILCTKSPTHGGRSTKYFKGFENKEEEVSNVPWAAISLAPSSYVPAYQAYAEDAFVPKKGDKRVQYLLPWNAMSV